MDKLLEESKKIETEIVNKIVFHSSGSGFEDLIEKDNFAHFGGQYEVLSNAYKNGKDIISELRAHGYSASDFLDDNYMFNPKRTSDVIAKELIEVSNAISLYKILEVGIQNIKPSETSKFVAELQTEISGAIKTKEVEESSASSLIDTFLERQKSLKERFLLGGGGTLGLSTGFPPLDEIIDGLRPEHIWIIGGYTSMGKSFAALNLVKSVINQGKRAVFYSLEMSKEDILARLLGVMTEINGMVILKGMPHNEMEVEDAMEKIKATDFSVYTTKTELSDIINSMKNEHEKNPVSLFVLDFVQLVNLKKSKSEYETISNTMVELQKTAKLLGVPIVILSQVSNDGAKMDYQNVMSFKGSGAIAAAADIAIEIVSGEENHKILREKIYAGQKVCMDWVVRKNRHGKVGTIQMEFDGRTGVSKLAGLDNF